MGWLERQAEGVTPTARRLNVARRWAGQLRAHLDTLGGVEGAETLEHLVLLSAARTHLERVEAVVAHLERRHAAGD